MFPETFSDCQLLKAIAIWMCCLGRDAAAGWCPRGKGASWTREKGGGQRCGCNELENPARSHLSTTLPHRSLLAGSILSPCFPIPCSPSVQAFPTPRAPRAKWGSNVSQPEFTRFAKTPPGLLHFNSPGSTLGLSRPSPQPRCVGTTPCRSRAIKSKPGIFPGNSAHLKAAESSRKQRPGAPESPPRQGTGAGAGWGAQGSSSRVTLPASVSPLWLMRVLLRRWFWSRQSLTSQTELCPTAGVLHCLGWKPCGEQRKSLLLGVPPPPWTSPHPSTLLPPQAPPHPCPGC